MEKVFNLLREANLKLALEKCFFFQEKVHFLGHVVSGAGIETDLAKTEKVLNWQTPKTPEELISFFSL